MISTQKNQAYAYLREMIVTGALPPGDRLSDYALSKQIGIGRAPIREAIGRLESDGLVEQIPHYGAFIRKPDRQEVLELYELRMLLEGDAVYKAASRMDRQQLDQLKRNCLALRKLVRQCRGRDIQAEFPDLLQELIRLDFDFHMQIIQAAGNRTIAKLVGDSRVIISLMNYNTWCSSEVSLEIMNITWRDHAYIVRALRRRDGQAARERLVRHIDVAMHIFLKKYDDHAAAAPRADRAQQA